MTATAAGPDHGPIVMYLVMRDVTHQSKVKRMNLKTSMFTTQSQTFAHTHAITTHMAEANNHHMQRGVL